MKKNRTFLIIYAALALSLLVYLTIALIAPDILQDYFTGEFGAPEVLTATCFLAAALLALSILQWHRDMKWWAIGFFAFLAFFFFVCAGEEMSWGQHLLGYKTPEKVAQINEQGEFNLHNLELEHIHPKDIVSWFMKIYGIILPMVLIKSLLRKGHVFQRYLPHPALVGCFALPELINLFQEPWDKALRSQLGPDVYMAISSQAEEVQEMYWAIAIMLAMLLIRRRWSERAVKN